MRKINETDFRDFKMIGENEIHLDKVFKKFNKNCAIYQNNESYRLSQVNGIITNIPKIQAIQLIDLLKLYPVKCPPFVNATTWRLENIIK